MSTNIVHLIDDDEAVRAALVFLLASAGHSVRAYDSASAFLDSPVPLAPGCIVTDVRMPGLSGLDLQRTLTERRIFLPVIVITGHGDVPLAVAAMKNGAVDFIEKPFSDDTLLAAVEEGFARQARALAGAADAEAILARLRRLTPREAEVLDGLVQGLPNKSIAYDLNISARTVEIHRANLMEKMQAGSLPDLVRMVLTARAAP